MVWIEWLFTVVYVYLLFNSAYLLVFAVAGKLKGSNGSYGQVEQERSIAILIPCYKDDLVIVDTVRVALAQNYGSFKILVAAEGLRQETIALLSDLPIRLLIVDFGGKSTKAKALHALIQEIPSGKFDILLLLDSDNIIGDGSLTKLNAAFASGWRSVQLQRVAKNSNTDVAVLDGISEEINNNIFRRGQRALGFSSCLIGSAMAFEEGILRQILSSPTILNTPGEDREMDTFLIKRGIVTEFLDGALVFDEKVFNEEHYQKQRTRWYEAQFSHIRSLLAGVSQPGHKGKDFWNRIFINQIPPRLLMLACMVLIIFLKLALEYLGINMIKPSIGSWLFLLMIFIFAMLISIPEKYLTTRTLFTAIRKIPMLILYMFRAILHIKPGRKEFLHTPKTYEGE